MYVNKGKISAVIDKNHATVVPSFSGSPVTTELVIPFFLLDCLEVGMDVVYAQFPDNTGLILARMDGEWSHALAGNVEIKGSITAGDIVTGSVPSYNGHTHTCPDGETSGPK